MNDFNKRAIPNTFDMGARHGMTRDSLGGVIPLSRAARSNLQLRFADSRELPPMAPTFLSAPGVGRIPSFIPDTVQHFGVPTGVDKGRPSAISAMVWRNIDTGVALLFDRYDEDVRAELLRWHQAVRHLPLVIGGPGEPNPQCLVLESDDELVNELSSPIPDDYWPAPLRIFQAMQTLRPRPELDGVVLCGLLSGSPEKFEQDSLLCFGSRSVNSGLEP